jgi:superfamily I DNA/RNA helicase
VVGDDAQSIYAFRGANINILNFQKDYEGVKLSDGTKLPIDKKHRGSGQYYY